MTAPAFVATNVLAQTRNKHRGQTRRGRLSLQVLNEYFVTVTRKLPQTLSLREAQEEIRDLMAWNPVPVDAELLERAWSAATRWQLSHWDSLIVAAAERTGCEQLLTEDLQDGQTLGGLQITNPFTTPPG